MMTPMPGATPMVPGSLPLLPVPGIMAAVVDRTGTGRTVGGRAAFSSSSGPGRR